MAEGRAVNCEPTRVAWTWRHAVCASDLAPTTRHVLLTLSMFMNEMGESCHPSMADLCRYSGLDKKTVLKHIAIAREAGWVGVSRHGYRGQKWKRQEYAARWPERDLIAPCAPDDGEERGGRVPPPSEVEKVVESTVEGGGTEGAKVVEHVHQDKTSPENIPNTSPVEREARGREDGKSEAVDAEDVPNRAAFQKRVMRFCSGRGFVAGVWKDWDANGSFDWVCRQFAALLPEERLSAEKWRDAYLLDIAARKKTPQPPGVWLRDKVWCGLDTAILDRAEKLRNTSTEPAKAEFAKAFSPVWAGRIFRQFVTGQKAFPAPKAWEEAAIASGSLDRAAVERDLRLRGGWPAVNAMYRDAAQRGAGITNPTEEDILAGELCEFVPVDTDTFRAWRRHLDNVGWPWPPHSSRGAYFPAGGPGALGDFEAAIRSDREQVHEAAE